MNDPLFNIRKVTQIDFFSNPEGTVEEFAEYFRSIYNDVKCEKLDSGKYTVTSMEREISYKLEAPEEACVLLFEKWEQDLRYNISERIYKDLDHAKIEVYINLIVTELAYIQQHISSFRLSDDGGTCRDHIIGEIKILQDYLTHLKQQFSGTQQKEVKPPLRIKWLGPKNQLPTLLFDLWEGQKGTSKNPKEFPALIDPDTPKEALMSLILDNFVDKDGKPFSPSSVSDQLNRSEEKNRSRAIKYRIELSLK